jgi:hypothetical protein
VFEFSLIMKRIKGIISNKPTLCTLNSCIKCECRISRMKTAHLSMWRSCDILYCLLKFQFIFNYLFLKPWIFILPLLAYLFSLILHNFLLCPYVYIALLITTETCPWFTITQYWLEERSLWYISMLFFY